MTLKLLGQILLPLLTATAAAAVPTFEVRNLPEPRDSHGSAIIGRTLYIVGGAITTAWAPTQSVLAAPILRDLTLGQWREVTPLPERTLYIPAGVVAGPRTLYVIGGQNRLDERTGDHGEKRIRNTAYYATVTPNGDLGPWTETSPWTTNAGLSCAAAIGRAALYVSGGGDPNDTTSREVHYAPLAADGTPGPWQPTAPLPVGLWFHQMIVQRETAFVLLGRTNSSAEGLNRKIFRARIQQDGALGPWREGSGAMPNPVFQSAPAATGSYAFVAGGTDRNWAIVDNISYGSLTSTGIINWRTIPIPEFRQFKMAAAASGELGVLYISGGRPKPEHTIMSDRILAVQLKRDADVQRNELPPGLEAAYTYEHALHGIRRTGAPNLLLATISDSNPQSITWAAKTCQRLNPPGQRGVPLAILNITKDPQTAKDLGLVQAGILAYITPEETIQSRTTTPLSDDLPE